MLFTFSTIVVPCLILFRVGEEEREEGGRCPGTESKEKLNLRTANMFFEGRVVK